MRQRLEEVCMHTHLLGSCMMAWRPTCVSFPLKGSQNIAFFRKGAGDICGPCTLSGRVGTKNGAELDCLGIVYTVWQPCSSLIYRAVLILSPTAETR